MGICIDANVCKGCLLCLEECPKKALSPGTERSAKGYLMPAPDTATCVSCGLCELLCPDQAITTIKEERRA
jgi:2-oxoglutarate ferredoxin oxidoreductase subunit delta